MTPNPNTSPELLPCPFCGTDNVALYRPALSKLWAVHCDESCDFKGPTALSKAKAVFAWNTRAPSPQTLPAPGEVEIPVDMTGFAKVVSRLTTRVGKLEQNSHPPVDIASVVDSRLAELAITRAHLMGDEAKTGKRVLVYFTGKGWVSVAWKGPYGDNSNATWCVDDDNFGPYALRGYREGDDTHWLSLPDAPLATVAAANDEGVQKAIAGVLLCELSLDPDRRWDIAGTIAAAIRPLSQGGGKDMASTPVDQGCKVPPEGWWCSRPIRHEGPCAARRTGEV
jgi:hypothetical protein